MWRADLPPAQASVAVGGAAAAGPDADRPGLAEYVAAGPDPGELDALDRLGSSGTWEVFGRRLKVTNLDKGLFPARGDEAPVTKREVIRCAARIAPVALT